MEQGGCVLHLIGCSSNIMVPVWLRGAEPTALSEAGSRTVKVSLLSFTAQGLTGILSLGFVFLFLSLLEDRSSSAGIVSSRLSGEPPVCPGGDGERRWFCTASCSTGKQRLYLQSETVELFHLRITELTTPAVSSHLHQIFHQRKKKDLKHSQQRNRTRNLYFGVQEENRR